MLLFFFFQYKLVPGVGPCTMAFVARPSPRQHAGNSEPHCGTSHAMNDSWGLSCKMQDQIALLSAAVGNALTTVLAGFALTTTSWPNIILLVALVAGFLPVLILARPGMVKTPDFLTSAAPTSAKEPKSVVTTLFFSSQLVERESAMAPLVMAFEPAAFIPPFAMAVCGRIDATRKQVQTAWSQVRYESSWLKGHDQGCHRRFSCNQLRAEEERRHQAG